MVINENISLQLSEDNILLVDKSLSKQQLLTLLTDKVCKGTNISNKVVLDTILKREQGISTTLETGLSIPHARIAEIDKFYTACAIIPKGIVDDFGLNIKVMFLFLSPQGQQFFPTHLKLLAKLAETFTPNFIEKLTKLNKISDIAKELNF